AWTTPIPRNPSARSLPTLPCTRREDGGTAPRSVPAPDSQVPCTSMLWATPHGFLKAAQARHATSTSTPNGVAVSFRIAGNQTMTGLIDGQHHVGRVETSIAQSIVGDMIVTTEFSDYKDYGGVQFPRHI